MLYEVITNNEPILIVDGIRVDNRPAVGSDIGVGTFPFSGGQGVITSYSIHYTKLYDVTRSTRN